MNLEGTLIRKQSAPDQPVYWLLHDPVTDETYYLKGPNSSETHVLVRLFERWGDGTAVVLQGELSDSVTFARMFVIDKADRLEDVARSGGEDDVG